MACQDCFNTCIDSPVSDQCIKYTGPDSDALGIKSGTALYCVEQSLITYLSSILDGTGISIDVSTSCTLLTNLVNSDKSLKNILQSYASAICSLQSSIGGLTAAAVSYDASCLTLPANPTTADVVKALVSKICSLDTRVSTIESSYVKAADVSALVKQYVAAGVSTQEYTKMPKYVALPYHGSLSNFDSSGKGISSAGYDKVYLCIGQTVGGFTLPDYRGRSPLGVNINMPGGAMDSKVDPALSANASYKIGLNTKQGEYAHALSSTENGPHGHTVNDPGHSHWIEIPSRDFKNNAGSGPDLTHDGGGDTRSFQTASTATGISVNNSGNGEPHNNLHPSVGAYFIMYLPN